MQCNAMVNEETPVDQDDLDYYGIVLANLLNNRQILPDKRSCIRRGRSCDHRPNDCCPNESCKFDFNISFNLFQSIMYLVKC